MTTESSSIILGFLEGAAELMRRSGQRGGAAWLLEHGRHWTPKPLPRDEIKPGANRECFANCQRAAADRRRWIYCEGYAIGIIPVMHAWLLDTQDGQIVDPTWTGNGKGARAPLGHEYFGVAIKTRYVVERLVATERYWPLLDDWQNGWPLQNAPVKDWKHT